jgi:hypothetical protein
LITKAKFKAKMRKKGQEVLQLMTSKKLSWGLGVCGDCTYISLQLLVPVVSLSCFWRFQQTMKSTRHRHYRNLWKLQKAIS